MIRVMVNGGAEAIRSEVASRLRGGTIATSPEGGDAAVFIGVQCPDSVLIDQILSAGKHVLLAAESCLPMAALDTLAGVARQKGVQLAVENPDHFLPSRQLIRQQRDAGRLGEAGLVRVHRWKPAATDNKPPGLPGPLVRDLELVSWLIGKLPNLAYAVGHGANEDNPGAGAYVQVHLGFPGGAMAMIDHAASLPPGHGYHALSVIGSAGAAYADDHQNMQLVFRGGPPQAVRTGEGAKPLAALIQEFVDALQAGRDLSGSMAAWRSAWTVAEAVRRSLETHQAVPLEGR